MPSRWITPADEFLVHPVPARLREESPEASRAWFDHTELMILGPEPNDPVINSYLQVHPGIGMLHGYTIVKHDGLQHNVRGCRELSDEELNRSHVETKLGPISQTVGEPFQRWSFELGATAGSEIGVSASCGATTTPQLWPRMTQRLEGHAAQYQTYQDVLEQLIVVDRGRLTIGDQTWDLKGWQGFRDHCWGFRLARPEGGPAGHSWLPAFFPNRRLLLLQRQRADRSPIYTYAQLFAEDQTEEFTEGTMELFGEPGDRIPHRAAWTFGRSETGEPQHRLETGRIVVEQGTFIGGGWMGESPEDYYGSFRIEADIWDGERCRDAARRPGILGMARYRSEFRLDGEPGYGLLACFMTSDYGPSPSGLM